MLSRRHPDKALVSGLAAGSVLLVYGLIVDPNTGSGGIPCLWKSGLGFNCPGCGLSRAGALLLHGRFQEAARMNWLIFPFVVSFLGKLASQVFYLSKLKHHGGIYHG